MSPDTHPPGWPVAPLTWGGVRGRYSVRGDGPPVVLLPSLLALPRTYRPTAESLARRFRVYLPEVPGSGRADRLRRPWPLEAYAAWVRNFVTALDLTGVTLIGHSHAGAVALLAAAACPERVARLVIVDAALAGRPSVAGAFHDIAHDIGLVLRAWPDVAFNLVRHPRTFLYHARVCFRANLLPAAAGVRTQTLVGWGRDDRTLPLAHGHRYAAALPNAALYVCDTSSHNWLITRPDEFLRVISAFAAAAGPDVA